MHWLDKLSGRDRVAELERDNEELNERIRILVINYDKRITELEKAISALSYSNKPSKHARKNNN